MNQGELICMYEGELISKEEMDRRNSIYGEEIEASYYVELGEVG